MSAMPPADVTTTPAAPVVRITTRVLAGGRVEVASPELCEGDRVDVAIFRARVAPAGQAPSPEDRAGVLRVVESLPRRYRTPEEWAEFERQFQSERDSWDR